MQILIGSARAAISYCPFVAGHLLAIVVVVHGVETERKRVDPLWIEVEPAVNDLVVVAERVAERRKLEARKRQWGNYAKREAGAGSVEWSCLMKELRGSSAEAVEGWRANFVRSHCRWDAWWAVAGGIGGSRGLKVRAIVVAGRRKTSSKEADPSPEKRED